MFEIVHQATRDCLIFKRKREAADGRFRKRVDPMRWVFFKSRDFTLRRDLYVIERERVALKRPIFFASKNQFLRLNPFFDIERSAWVENAIVV